MRQETTTDTENETGDNYRYRKLDRKQLQIQKTRQVTTTDTENETGDRERQTQNEAAMQINRSERSAEILREGRKGGETGGADGGWGG